MIHTNIKAFILVMLTLSGMLLFSCAVKKSIALKHPLEIQGMPQCSECHTDWKASLDHRPDWIKKHQFFVPQQKQICDGCHAESYCFDCHAKKEEIKPSDMFKDAPERTLPHPGDYLNQHKIDGKLNPASCVPCHGRQNNERCRVCHR